MATTFMGLNLPIVSTTIGPTWATLLNTALTLIDSHTHVTGQGQQVPTAGINVNADFPFNSFNIISLRSARLISQTAPLSLPTDINSIFVTNGELWFNNSAGVGVQLTLNGTINISSIGGVTGLGGTSAAITYNSATGTFVFTQAPNQAASIDVGNVIIRNPVGTGNPGITLRASPSQTTWTLQLPAAAPTVGSFLTVGPLGISNYLGTGALTGGNLTANAGILGSQLAASAGILRTQIAGDSRQVISSSSGGFLTSSATFSNVTNLSVTITTNGRPVLIYIQPDSSNPMLIGGTTGEIQIVRSSGLFQSWNFSGGGNGTMMAIDTIAAGTAGTYSYSVQARSTSGFTFSVFNVVLVAYEL